MSLDHFNALTTYDETDQGRVMAWEVIRQPVTTYTRVSPQGTLRGIYVVRIGNWTGFSPSTSVFFY
jgi:hypothetical protein